jgi:CDGSH-type Zn-finger protein
MNKKPYCDGAHKKLNAQLKETDEKFAPLRFTCEESRSVLLCMCKSSSNRPFCDGSHEVIKPEEKQKF